MCGYVRVCACGTREVGREGEEIRRNGVRMSAIVEKRQSDEQKEKGRLVCTLTDKRGRASDASDAKQVKRPTRSRSSP
jgi:hypothetical protein